LKKSVDEKQLICFKNLLFLKNFQSKKQINWFLIFKKNIINKYYRFNDFEVSVGNFKLGSNTIIYNMNAAHDCPSQKLGLCKIKNHCYARRDEKQYEVALKRRRRQEIYWDKKSPDDICQDFKSLLTSIRFRDWKTNKLLKLEKKIKYFRFNESGDFKTIKDIEKLNLISKFLMDEFGIITYGYSSRKDLFEKIKSKKEELHFICHGSGHDNCPDGKTIVMKNPKNIEIINGIKFFRCPMFCYKCDLCKIRGKNIVFKIH
jgi:hypothetical protein